MAGRLEIRLDAGEPRTGVWCPFCNLPAAIAVDMLHITGRGVSTIATATVCRTCGPIRKAACNE